MKTSFICNRFTMFWLLVLMAANVVAQPDSAASVTEVVKDARIDQLVKKQAQINKVSVYKNSRGDFKGYRIMLLSTNNRDLAYKTRADLLRYFPDQNVYMGYQSPYYKIKLGDFLKRADAEKMKKDLSSVFSQSTFVIQDIIKLSPEDEAKLMKEAEEENP